MKLKEYALQQVTDLWILFPLGDATKAGGDMLKLNDTGAMLWRGLEAGKTADALADELVDQFGVSREEAKADVDAFIANLRENGCIED